MTKQQQFFYDNAGFSIAPGETTEQGKERCAIALANAETQAAQEGIEFIIEPDPDADESWMDDEPQEYQDEWRGKAWYCQAVNANGEVLASVGGCYGDRDYRRVIRAELAIEALA